MYSLINLLHQEIKNFNKNYERNIQFVISPTGIWKSGIEYVYKTK